MATIKTDPASRGILNYSNALKIMNKSAFPLAVRGTLNALAFETRKNLSEVQMPKKFQLRNDFENKKSLNFKKSANTFDINKMASGAGQLRTVRFRRGPKQTKDLFTQELGRTQGPRAGKSFTRTPMIQARKGKSFSQPVAAANQPSKNDNWLKMREIERNMGIRNGSKMPLASRRKRVHAIMVRHASITRGQKYVLPSASDPAGTLHVFKVVNKKPVLLHVMKRSPKKLKKRETVKPAFQIILKTRADAIFKAQADHRVKTLIRKKLAGKG